MAQVTSIAQTLRYLSLTSTTAAGSGHPTSCLSAADIMAEVMFGGWFRYDIDHPDNPHNDRLIFSKGHAAPLFYALWAVAGAIKHADLSTLRLMGSALEGHPTMKFRYTEVPTGSLGQGLSVGVGMALYAKLDRLDFRTVVLLGDSEMAEGSVWEALAFASHKKIGNLWGIIDVNRLGQRGETMFGHDVAAYEKRVRAFGWETITVDGHDHDKLREACALADRLDGGEKPIMIIARTYKGAGVSFLQDKDGWHGKALKKEDLERALNELGDVDAKLTVPLPKPTKTAPITRRKIHDTQISYKTGEQVATREAYGHAIASLTKQNPDIIVLDAETSNSTFAETVQKETPEQFIEMYIAESNMIGVATGLARRGKVPFTSTFAAFLTRAYDQIRMAAYGYTNLKIVGSHAGVSIGEDGTSQMALEDLAMMRAVFGSVVLYPADATSTCKLVAEMAKYEGLAYMRTTRAKTPVIYAQDQPFSIGGSVVHGNYEKPEAVVIAAGITLHEALKAQKQLEKQGVYINVVDVYSVKPIDARTLQRVCQNVSKVIAVEDHYPEGGIAEAVRTVLPGKVVVSLAVREMPQSGKPEELLRFERIDAQAIVEAIVERDSAS
jgi:transketolase